MFGKWFVIKRAVNGIYKIFKRDLIWKGSVYKNENLVRLLVPLNSKLYYNNKYNLNSFR